MIDERVLVLDSVRGLERGGIVDLVRTSGELAGIWKIVEVLEDEIAIRVRKVA